MNIRWKAQIILFTMAVTVSALSAYSGFSSNNAMIEDAKRRELQVAAAQIQNSIADQTSKAAARASIVSSLPSIKQAFRAQSREEIAERLLPAMLVQRDQFDVREGQFILPPAISFLRIYALQDGHGEDLSDFRQMVLTANRLQEPQRGVEIGRRGLSIRGVYPVIDEQGLIGCFEIGMSFTPVLNDVKKIMGFEAGVFIDDTLMMDIATLTPRPDSERIVGGYQAVEVTNWDMLKPLVFPEMFTKLRDVSTYLNTVNGVDYGIVLVPVLDYKGEQIGAVMAARNFDEFQTQKKWALIKTVTMAGLQILLLMGVFAIVINGMLLNPFKAIANACNELAKGEPAADLASLAGRRDEVGDMAKSLQMLDSKSAAREPEHV